LVRFVVSALLPSMHIFSLDLGTLEQDASMPVLLRT
jgi:hypothetical protein